MNELNKVKEGMPEKSTTSNCISVMTLVIIVCLVLLIVVLLYIFRGYIFVEKQTSSPREKLEQCKLDLVKNNIKSRELLDEINNKQLVIDTNSKSYGEAEKHLSDLKKQTENKVGKLRDDLKKCKKKLK